MKALVTGAAGFVGSHMVDGLLARDAEVVAFDRRLGGKCLSCPALKRVSPFEADIRDLESVRSAAEGCDAIFHFAAVVGVEAYDRHAERMAEVERMGLRNVCRAAAATGARVLYSSSSAVYGHSRNGLAHREDAVCSPASNYARAKFESESHLRQQCEDAGISGTALRIFNVYGPRQDERLVVPRFVRLAKSGEPIVIFGDGSQTRDFVWVGTVVEAALSAVEALRGFNILNACTGRETSIRKVAEMIIARTSSTSALDMRAPPSARTSFEVDRSVGCPNALIAVLSRPILALEAGLDLTVAANP